LRQGRQGTKSAKKKFIQNSKFILGVLGSLAALAQKFRLQFVKIRVDS